MFRRRSSTRRTGLGLASIGLALATAGCGGGSAGSAAPPASSTSSSAAATSSPSAASVPASSPPTSTPSQSSAAPSPSGSAQARIRRLPASAVKVPADYTVRILPVSDAEITGQLGPRAAEVFSSFLNGALVRRGSLAGTVQVFRLTPRAAALGDVLLPQIVNGFTQGAKTSSAVVAGQRVTTAKNVRRSGLDLLAWQRGPDVVLLTLYPRKGDLEGVAASIIRNQRG